ncbi:ABC transporter permease [Paracoccus denitrificans]|uniref:ABC transporter permease n=1 Tax=Paracoccus denitrificans TaxID=266 RepID=UPI000CEC770D|nr:ABC transporter permease [Paracoccus denitrificans]
MSSLLNIIPIRGVRLSPGLVVSLIIVGFWIICAILGSRITPYDPLAVSVIERLQPPSAAHWFGTDKLGRDVLSRVMAGSRSVVEISLSATAIAITIGTIFGLITGYFRGVVSELIMRVFEALLAVPVVLLAMIAIVAVGASSLTVLLVIGVVFVPVVARTVRAAVLAERNRSYIHAALMRAESMPYILFREILPNITGTIVVEATVRLGYAIFVTATLSFLGLGVQPPTPDWGLSIYESYGMLSAGFWWPVAFPALAIASLVISINIIAEKTVIDVR